MLWKSGECWWYNVIIWQRLIGQQYDDKGLRFMIEGFG
jgi:hypothetical protein